MSRFILISSLVFGLSSLAITDRADAQFAKAPPVASNVTSPDTPVASIEPSDPPMGFAPAELRVAPSRPLDRAVVRRALARARATNLAAFRVYQKKGVFPSNTFTDKKLNVWLDDNGNFCAAATLIKMSGQDDLVNRTAEQNNFIRLADVKQGPLMDWILMSGFTQGEIAAIQEPFMPVVREPSLDPVTPILVDAKLRKTEDVRLRAKYRAVEKMLIKKQSASLDLATERLMKNPRLAWQLIDSLVV